MINYWLERAWIDGAVVNGVGVQIADGRFAAVEAQPTPPVGSVRLPGLSLPGFANVHSHAFHRALRGRTQQGTGTFWTWREQMYALAARLDPDRYRTLAAAVFAEMVAAGFTAVGEFHYLHHDHHGRPYGDPNAMGHAVLDAAAEAGIRITLLDTCYLAAGIGRPAEGVQRRFNDGSAEAWAARVSALAGGVSAETSAGSDSVRIGAAVHSIRAVDPASIAIVADWANSHDAPLHVHLSEQPAENEACLAAYGTTPTAVLAAAGALSPRTTAVHATHLTDDDSRVLGQAGVTAGFCPTTEADLGDGIGPSEALRAAGANLSIGSDSHAAIDALGELRSLEWHNRLATGRRGGWSAAELIMVGAGNGHRALGFPDAGTIAVGARADLVTLDQHGPAMAGAADGIEAALFAGSPADISQVIIDGEVRFRAAERPELGRRLAAAIEEAWR